MRTLCLIFFFSAGVGRTGSFIAIDSLIEQMETEKVVDVYGFVAQMRKQRNYMVQTEVSCESGNQLRDWARPQLHDRLGAHEAENKYVRPHPHLPNDPIIQ